MDIIDRMITDLRAQGLADEDIVLRLASITHSGDIRRRLAALVPCTCGPSPEPCPAHDAHDRRAVARALARTFDRKDRAAAYGACAGCGEDDCDLTPSDYNGAGLCDGCYEDESAAGQLLETF